MHKPQDAIRNSAVLIADIGLRYAPHEWRRLIIAQVIERLNNLLGLTDSRHVAKRRPEKEFPVTGADNAFA
ncbi:hypothetical protein I4183_28830 [Klebsiella pneumoniae]|nr:hypothetical protein [Klebsiella pneumoniae]